MSDEEGPAQDSEAEDAWLHPSNWVGSADFGTPKIGRIYGLTWNVQRALAPGNSVRSLQARWFALLDSLLRLGISFCCLQETGVGSLARDRQHAMAHVKTWSRLRNTPRSSRQDLVRSELIDRKKRRPGSRHRGDRVRRMGRQGPTRPLLG